MNDPLQSIFKKVFVTVGTSRFDSLLRKVDEEDFQNELKNLGYTHILYQVGRSRFVPRLHILQVTVVQYLDNFEETIDSSDLIISHLGAGNLLEIFSKEKKSIFVPNPRLKHQSELLEVLDPRFVSNLDNIKQSLNFVSSGNGPFYNKLLVKSKFNELLYSLVDLDSNKNSGKITKL